MKTNWRIGSGGHQFLDLGWLDSSLDRRSIRFVELELAYDPLGEPHANLTVDFLDERSRTHTTAAIVFHEGTVGFSGERVDQSAIDEDRAGFSYLRLDPVVGELPTGARFQQTIDLSGSTSAFFDMAQHQRMSARYLTRLSPRQERLDLARTLVGAIADSENKFKRIGGLTRNLRDTFGLLQADGWFVEEAYGIPATSEAEHGRWVVNRLADDVRAAQPYISDELLSWAWCSADAVWSPSTDTSEIQGRRRPEFLKRVAHLALPFLRSSTTSGGAPPPSMTMTPISESQRGGFLFVSYAHKNSEFVRKVCRRLAEQRIEYWVDDQLQLGGIWDEEIEEKIRNCDGFVACVSHAYQGSKICRRELKYADMLNKPIFPLSFDGYLWGEGLELMFSSLQIVELSDVRFTEKLLERVRWGAPDVIG